MKCMDCGVEIMDGDLCARCNAYHNDPVMHPGICPVCGNDHATDDPADYDAGYACFKFANMIGGDIGNSHRSYQLAMQRYCDEAMKNVMNGPLPSRCPHCRKEHAPGDVDDIIACSDAIRDSNHEGCNPPRGLCLNLEFGRYLCYLQDMTVEEAKNVMIDAFLEVEAENDAIRALVESMLE